MAQADPPAADARGCPRLAVDISETLARVGACAQTAGVSARDVLSASLGHVDMIVRDTQRCERQLEGCMNTAGEVRAALDVGKPEFIDAVMGANVAALMAACISEARITQVAPEGAEVRNASLASAVTQ